MTPEELKKSILQLAIQGKLVEQRLDEGTADDLYAQIQAEKQRLINEGKIKKEKSLPEIADDEIPFDIPDSWKWTRLNTIVFNHGQTIPIDKFSYIDIGSIDNANQKLNVEEKIIEAKDAPSRARKVVVEGDIIYSTVRPYLHNMCIIDRSFSYPPIASTGFAVMSCVSGVYNKFLFYYLLSPDFDSYANDTENSKGVAYPAINDDRLYRALVPLPPIEEQKRIVAKIEELLPLVDKYADAYNRLEELNKTFPGDLKKSILQYAIQGKLVEQRPEEGTADDLYAQIQVEKQKLIKEGKIKKEKPLPEITDDEIPFDIPDSWKWCRLGSLAFFQGGFAFKSVDYTSTSNNQVVRLGNVKNNLLKIDEKQVFVDDELAARAKEYRICENDILVTMTGTLRKKDYFFTHLINKKDISGRNLFLNQRVGCFRVIGNVHPEYVLLVMQTESIRDLIFLKETGTANQGNLGSEDMKKYVYIPLPPLEEQKRIVYEQRRYLDIINNLSEAVYGRC